MTLNITVLDPVVKPRDDNVETMG
ncbi:MAG TPA: palindromic element RPE4 domain-containing protein [Rickettsia endosymbiont of Bembidion nr. Transversale]|nr:palindromic element RPE4 domain-containing protein [Rickettsia endosymbiont of Bembidion nr. Transversale]